MSPSRPTVRATIVIPCFNEASRLDVDSFRAFLSDVSDVRILFVDDGSLDGTGAILNSLHMASDEQVGVLPLGRNKGKAEAVRAGVCFALGQWNEEFVGYWDADLATPLSSIVSFVNLLDSHPSVDIVFGSRVKLCGRNIHRRPLRHYLGRVFATVVSVMLGLSIYDTQCGAKLFRINDTLRKVFEDPFASKWVFDVEILARLLQQETPQELEHRLYEYPLEHWQDVAGSKVQAADFLKAIGETAAIHHRYMRSSRKS